MNDTLAKPIDREKLLHTLQRWAEKPEKLSEAATVTVIEPEQERFDHRRFNELVDTVGRDALTDLIDSVMVAVTDRLVDLERLRDGPDVREIHAPAHQLISLFGNFALTRLHLQARRLAAACLAGNRSEALPLIDRLVQEAEDDLPLLAAAVHAALAV
jgi:hypothetical protein